MIAKEAQLNCVNATLSSNANHNTKSGLRGRVLKYCVVSTHSAAETEVVLVLRAKRVRLYEMAFLLHCVF